MMENSFQKYDTLAKELKKAIIDAKPRLSDTDKSNFKFYTYKKDASELFESIFFINRYPYVI